MSTTITPGGIHLNAVVCAACRWKIWHLKPVEFILIIFHLITQQIPKTATCVFHSPMTEGKYTRTSYIVPLNFHKLENDESDIGLIITRLNHKWHWVPSHPLYTLPFGPSFPASPSSRLIRLDSATNSTTWGLPNANMNISQTPGLHPRKCHNS